MKECNKCEAIKEDGNFEKNRKVCNNCRNIYRTKLRRNRNIKSPEEKYSLKGKRFGFWTVDKRVIDNKNTTNTKWICKCVCGHKKKIFAFTLRSGRTKSCGCKNVELRKQTCLKKYGKEAVSQVKEIALKQAKSRNDCHLKIHWKSEKQLICQGSYEAKTVDYLNKNKIDFVWQPKVFYLKKINRHYRPDLYIKDIKKWIEIKGYIFRQDALDKWNEFKKIRPNSEFWNKEKLKELMIL